jgi:hypothetical protein
MKTEWREMKRKDDTHETGKDIDQYFHMENQLAMAITYIISYRPRPTDSTVNLGTEF